MLSLLLLVLAKDELIPLTKAILLRYCDHKLLHNAYVTMLIIHSPNVEYHSQILYKNSSTILCTKEIKVLLNGLSNEKILVHVFALK